MEKLRAARNHLSLTRDLVQVPSAHPRKRILFTGLYYCRSFDTSDFTLSTQLPFLDSPAMSRFKMSAALWDRIHHFASFPQTGGTLLS